MSPLNGGFAFPWRQEEGDGSYHQHVGMTLRDYLAGQALVGITSSETRVKMSATDGEVARAAYDYADAMLAARFKTEGKK
jgi:hypothetical protein